MLRNKPNQSALIVPAEDACADMLRHAGKVVTPVRHTFCGLGEKAWETTPILYDDYGNPIAWDDRDLKPLGETTAQTNDSQVAAEILNDLGDSLHR